MQSSWGFSLLNSGHSTVDGKWGIYFSTEIEAMRNWIISLRCIHFNSKLRLVHITWAEDEFTRSTMKCTKAGHEGPQFLLKNLPKETLTCKWGRSTIVKSLWFRTQLFICTISEVPTNVCCISPLIIYHGTDSLVDSKLFTAWKIPGSLVPSHFRTSRGILELARILAWWENDDGITKTTTICPTASSSNFRTNRRSLSCLLR